MHRLLVEQISNATKQLQELDDIGLADEVTSLAGMTGILHGSLLQRQMAGALPCTRYSPRGMRATTPLVAGEF